MERWKSLAGTLAAVTVVVGLEHFYLWVALIRDAGLSRGLEVASSVLLALLAASVPFAVVWSRIASPQRTRWLVTPVYTWLGTSVVLTALLALTSATRLPAVLALLPATALSAWAAIEGRRVHVRRVEVPLARLPRALDGFTIVQLSDVHLGPTVDRRFMEDVVARTNALNADAVVITGDLIDAPVDRLLDEVEPLTGLHSRFGTWFVTGNHEYHADAQRWCRHLESLGVRVLRNELARLEHNGDVLQLAGTDDSDPAGAAQGFHEDLELALRNRDVDVPVVLLAHQPKSVHQASQLGVDLQLSGHTHGGQLWPLGWLLRASQPAVSGLHRFGSTMLYVSNGTGHSGPPMRLGTPAEITQLVLRPAISSSASPPPAR